MQTFTTCEIVNGILVPLAVLLKRLSFAGITLWVFRDVRLHSGRPLDLSVIEFERLSHEAAGISVPASKIPQVATQGFQMIDGKIDGYAQWNSIVPLLRIECLDATQWEITTDSNQLANELESNGFLKKKH